MTRLIALAALMCTFTFASAAAYPDISHDDLVAAMKANTVTLIDVNGSASFSETHIPGAIDFEAVGDDLASKLPADKNALIVAYCGGPKCGAYKYAAKAAVALGYTNVKHYSAGIKGWKASAEGQAAAKTAEAGGAKAMQHCGPDGCTTAKAVACPACKES